MVIIRKQKIILPGFIAVISFAFILYIILNSAETMGNSFIQSYEIIEQKAGDELIYKVLWFFGDMTEAQFYKSYLAGIGVILFAFIAYMLDRRKSRFAGFAISYGTGLWPWVLISSGLGLALSILFYGHLLGEGWLPTFIPFVSIPAGVVLLYGGGWKNVFTGSILGGLLGFPIASFIIETFLMPLELPNVIGSVTAMWLGGIIAFEVCKYLPWMKLASAEEEDFPRKETAAATERAENPNQKPVRGSKWFIRRVLADFTEAQFFGNEWASIGLLLGVILMWLLNPLHPVYGSGLLPAVLLSQFLTLSFSNFLYFEKWEQYGWYPTFVPVVSVAPAAVLAFGGTMTSIIFGALGGALIGPPIAHMVIRSLPKHWHPVVGNTFSMALSTLIVVLVLSYLPFT